MNEFIANVVQGKDKPTLSFFDRVAFIACLIKHIGKRVKIKVTLYDERSVPQNNMYHDCVQACGHSIYYCLSVNEAKNKLSYELKQRYAERVLCQPPIVSKNIFGETIVTYEFSIAFEKLPSDEANDYYEWAFDTVLEYVNQNRENKLEDIKDYVDEFKQGVI